jgi:hypothetical protein
MKQRMIAALLVLVIFIPGFAFAEDTLNVSISDISNENDGISVTLKFENNSDQTYSFGWVGDEGYLIATTDTDSYAISMSSPKDRIERGESEFAYFLEGASGDVKEIKITGIIPLDSRGLPISNLQGGGWVREKLDDIVFSADMLPKIIDIPDGKDEDCLIDIGFFGI